MKLRVLGFLVLTILLGGSKEQHSPYGDDAGDVVGRVLSFGAAVPAALGSAVLHAQEPGRFDFPDDDEEEAPSWRDDVRAQALDISLVAAFCGLAFVSFFKKSAALKYVTFVAAVGYLGFSKSQLISVVNIFGLFGGNLPVFRYNLAWYLLAVLVVISTILWGRVYCGRMCAFGAMTQLLDRIVPARWRVTVPRTLERRAALIKYGILTGAIAYFVITKNPLIYPYIEPFWLFGFHGTSWLWVALSILLLATVFVRNLYCRFLCPVGAALGLLSKLTVFRIKRWSECGTCRICEKACEWGAIRGPQIIQTECVRCDDCERLYDDTAKCPHHLIILKRPGLIAAGRLGPDRNVIPLTPVHK